MICILSDTHDNQASVETFLAEISKRSIERFVHCGDITSPSTLEKFKGLPFSFVFGNMDSDTRALGAKAQECGIEEFGESIEFSHSGKSFFVYHGTSSRYLEQAIESQNFDYVLHGHTHQLRDELFGQTRVINPGALYRAKVYTFALLEPASGELEIVEIPT